jgi:hypothetical protein
MPSSISSSERTISEGVSSGKRIDRFTVTLLCTAVVFLLIMEVISRVSFDSTSKVQRREAGERHSLLAVNDSGSSKDPHIALLGNSLMLEGIDLSMLTAKLEPNYVPVPYFVLGTNYYDWYFGLKRLFAEGMRPRYIVLGLSPNQLATSDLRGEMSARYLIQQSDLLETIRKTHMDATQASGFVLAHYSEFYSTRDTTRGFIMSRVLPNVGELLHERFSVYRDPEVPKSVLEPLAAERLSETAQLCRGYGATFVLVIPPTYQKGAETIVEAGKERGVSVLVPVKDNEFDSTFYQADGFHLNKKGSEIFTRRLSEELGALLPK